MARILSDENIAYIKANYEPRSPKFGAKALAKQFGVTQYSIAKLVRGNWQIEKRADCERCGATLTKWQRKYCNQCSHDVWRENSIKRMKLKAEEEARLGIKRPQRKGAANECEHMEWEADICLNCKRPSCNNCLCGMTLKEKEQMLEKSGGKRWLDD